MKICRRKNSRIVFHFHGQKTMRENLTSDYKIIDFELANENSYSLITLADKK